jgi:hypothetical protein
MTMREERTMEASELDVLGPVDYLVVEFPADKHLSRAAVVGAAAVAGHRHGRREDRRDDRRDRREDRRDDRGPGFLR